MVDLSSVPKMASKHKKEIEKFSGDGFTDGCLYENSGGETRMLVWTNYPIGVSGPLVKACSEGDTIIMFSGDKSGICTIAEWYNWLGSKWGLKEPVANPDAKPTMVDIAANARLASYEKGHVKTPKYPEPKDGKKWRSPKTRKPNS